ncbi:MAG: hypothetical protein QNK29_00915 [Desulfobacterales bacterium]|nr:hypothetical protein [Desulfobacterales bacterium]
MKPELIVMLTYNDQTIEKAEETFDSMKDLPVTHWGFKDVGLPEEKMARLVEKMKAAGKTTYLEVVSLSQEEGESCARLAAKLGFDVLMGTVYYDSILEITKSSGLKYYPFIGDVYGHPSVLSGEFDLYSNQIHELTKKGVDGFDLLTFRYTGNAEELLEKVAQQVKVPLISAGSIDSFRRIDLLRETETWGFTIGTAFFEKSFVPGGSFSENMMAVWGYCQR